MFKYIDTANILAALKAENETLKDSLAQARADLDFVAIMADVEIPETEGEEEQKNE